MGSVLERLFVNPATPQSGGVIPDDGYGFIQVLFLGAAYAYILLIGSNYISEGSELLLLVPSLAGVVGSVVLPVLGAVPDGAIVLFSGLGDIEEVEQQLSIGIGALAGSTVMLLTIPWLLALVGGRVPVIGGRPQYSRSMRDAPVAGHALTAKGVGPETSIRVNAIVMLATCLLCYPVVEIPALVFMNESAATESRDLKPFAWAGSAMCLLLFIGYLVLQFRMAKSPSPESSSELSKHLEAKIADARVKAIKKGDVSLRGALLQAIPQARECEFQADARRPLARANTLPAAPAPAESRSPKSLHSVVRPFFKRFDRNGDGKLGRDEIKGLLDSLGEPCAPADLDNLFHAADTDRSGDINYEEFVNWLTRLLQRPALEVPRSSTMEQVQGDGGDEEDDDEPEMPQDLKELSPEAQQSRVLRRSMWSMGLGTLLVLLFSDPMVDVLDTLGERTHVPAFYVAFLLAPLASNASEMIASYAYAQKRTQKSITISFSQLLGAACMNNTFCLLIFYLLIAVRGLTWTYHSEVAGIILVQVVVGIAATKKVHLVIHGLAVFSLLPICLAVVAVLKATVFKGVES